MNPTSLWFRSPDGDLLRRGEVENIWIDERRTGILGRKTFVVSLQWRGMGEGPDWEWPITDRCIAEKFRERLILVLCENPPPQNPTNTTP